jgi:proteasome lid subunit RPN8/RPN11
MAIVIAPTLLASIEKTARQSMPNECCGILIGTTAGHQSVVSRVIHTENVSKEDRRTHYEIAPQQAFDAFRDAKKDGLKVVGFYHSHTDGTTKPSRTDSQAAWTDQTYLIVSIDRENATGSQAWRYCERTAAWCEESMV